MNVLQQRFCPLCDRSFVENEAVLRCDGCGVMHHPSCWVKNDGCVTEQEHASRPVAQAYTTVRPMTAEARHPGEGTRRAMPAPPPAIPDDRGEVLPPLSRPPAGAPTERTARPDVARAAAITNPGPPRGRDDRERDDDPVIGAGASERPLIRHVNAVPPPVTPPGPRRYAPPHESASRAPMPQIYRRHPLLGYWYVPAAVAVAIGVALGVIWIGDQLFGGSGGGDQATISTASPSAQATQAGTADAGGVSTAEAGQSPSATASASAGKFRASDVVVVTGAGDCLNVRTAPGRTNPAIICLPDGAEVTVREGPQSAESLTWWKVSTTLGDGWAAEDYLVRKQ